jgi:hypothetical protein
MLKVSASQDGSDPNGWCRLRIEGLGLTEAEPLEIYIKRGGELRPFLAELGWQQNLHWLRFENTVLVGEGAVLRIGPAQTGPLSDVAAIEIGVRRPLAPEAEVRRARLAWPKIILAVGERPAVAPEPSPAPAPAPSKAPEGPVEIPPIIIDPPVLPRPEPVPAHGALWPWVAAGVIIAALALLGAAYLEKWPPFDSGTAALPAVPATAQKQFTEEEVRRFLAGSPANPAADAEAEAYAQAGHADLALLIYRYAQRQGDAGAAKAIGRMYDPLAHSPATSPFAAPDADQAATYYEEAAKAGDVEAEFLLGRLLTKGLTGQDNAVERGVVWLEKAQQGGNAEAGQLLAQIKGGASGGN